MHVMRRIEGLTASVVLTVVLAVALTSCSSEEPTHVGSSEEGTSAALGHVHGIGTDPGDGRVYLASHYGVFRVDEDAGVTRVADRWQDTMAFTVVGPGHFLASGHPDPREDLPVHLGLIESTDAGQTWEALSLQGDADFHAIEVAGQRIYGYDSVGSQLLVSEDRRSWRLIDDVALTDLAVHPDDHSRLLATTGQGRLVEYHVSTGTTRTELDAPPLAFVDWADAETLVGLGPDGTFFVSADGGRTWAAFSDVPGVAQAVEASGDRWYAATDNGVFFSTDRGRSWEPLVRQGG